MALESTARIALIAVVACMLAATQPACDRAAAASTDYDTATLERALQSPEPPVVIDVREPGEFAGGHVRGARNIPLGSLAQRASEVPRDHEVALICRSGRRSAQARDTLVQLGYQRVHNIAGGMLSWKGPVER